MWRARALLVGMLAFSTAGWAGLVTLDFETFGDSTSLTDQYTDFLFTNAGVWTAGLSLNDLEFPPHSGTNVAVDLGGPMFIGFTSPVLSFSAFFTYASPLTMAAFDSLNQPVGTTNSAFGSNFVSSGNPSNELLQVAFAGGISSISITGDPAGSSFALDDVTVTTPVSGVPEPSSGLMVAACFLLVAVLAVRRGRIRFNN